MAAWHTNRPKSKGTRVPKKRLPLESATQKAVATFMRGKGHEVRREVATPVGKIDIVVGTANGQYSLIECKRKNDVNSLKSAIGQLRAYAVYYPGSSLFICSEDKTPLSEASLALLRNNPDIKYRAVEFNGAHS